MTTPQAPGSWRCARVWRSSSAAAGAVRVDAAESRANRGRVGSRLLPRGAECRVQEGRAVGRGEGFHRFVREFLRPDPAWRALRRLPLGRHALSARTGRGGPRRRRHPDALRHRANRALDDAARPGSRKRTRPSCAETRSSDSPSPIPITHPTDGRPGRRWSARNCGTRWPAGWSSVRTFPRPRNSWRRATRMRAWWRFRWSLRRDSSASAASSRFPRASTNRWSRGRCSRRRGAENGAARRYLAFLKSKEARAIFDRFGFRLPD